ncbi:MAG: hypothetical protein FJY85_21555 [Deltaproteobacteria bacterium]|nr:hypothetical protein [Deltaproteobacteria bacterium]
MNVLREGGEVANAYRGQHIVFLCCQGEGLTEISRANSLKRVLQQLAAEAVVDDGRGYYAMKLLVFHSSFLALSLNRNQLQVYDQPMPH